LKAGKNVIGVEVSFYGHGNGTRPGGKPGLILYLDIATPGINQRVVTDQTWQTLLDRAHRPGQYTNQVLLDLPVDRNGQFPMQTFSFLRWRRPHIAGPTRQPVS
jgi:hypothetical protein